MERPKGICVISDKQRRVEVYNTGRGYQLQLYNSDPLVIAEVEQYREQTIDVKDGYRRTIMNVTEETMEAIVEAYITAKYYSA